MKRLRPNSDLGEVRWFFENYHFPAFIFEYPKDLAPMDHLERSRTQQYVVGVTEILGHTTKQKLLFEV